MGIRREMNRVAAIALSIALATAGVLVLGETTAKPKSPAGKHKHKRKRVKVSATVTLNETPVQSGTVGAARGCQRHRFVEFHRASNDALVGSATTNDVGGFGAASGYSGQAYALAKSVRRKKVLCLQVRSPVVSVGLADLRLTKAADGTVDGSPRYKLTVTNLGPDTAQEIVLTDIPKTVPANRAFSLDTANSSAGCSLASGVIKCTLPSLTPGQADSRSIVLSCGVPIPDSFLNSAAVASSAVDPNLTNNSVGNVGSDLCN